MCGEEDRTQLLFGGSDWDAVDLLRAPCKVVEGIDSVRVRVSVSGLLSGGNGGISASAPGHAARVPPTIMGVVATFAKRRLVGIPM